MATTLDRLQAEVDERMFTFGAQVTIGVAGEVVLDAALGDDGLGRPLTPSTVFRVYCTIKPVAALAVARLVEDGTLDLDEPLRARLPSIKAITDGVTLRTVLNHTAGLHHPLGVTMELTPPEQRRAVLDKQRPPPVWRVGHEAAYSEYFGWYVLGRTIEDATGEDLGSHLRRAVLEPLGMHDTYIGMSEDDFVVNRDRIGVNLDMRTERSFPLVFERTERICREVNCAYGGYTTSRDLEKLYAHICRARAGEAVPGLPGQRLLNEMTQASRPEFFDIILDRECGYGLGFMTALHGHHFGTQCSPSSFGHSGNVGSSFAFADPAADLTVAVIFNGIVDSESAFLRRPSLVRAIYQDLERSAADSGASEPVQDPPARRRFGRR